MTKKEIVFVIEGKKNQHRQPILTAQNQWSDQLFSLSHVKADITGVGFRSASQNAFLRMTKYSAGNRIKVPANSNGTITLR